MCSFHIMDGVEAQGMIQLLLRMMLFNSVRESEVKLFRGLFCMEGIMIVQGLLLPRGLGPCMGWGELMRLIGVVWRID